MLRVVFPQTMCMLCKMCNQNIFCKSYTVHMHWIHTLHTHCRYCTHTLHIYYTQHNSYTIYVHYIYITHSIHTTNTTLHINTYTYTYTAHNSHNASVMTLLYHLFFQLCCGQVWGPFGCIGVPIMFGVTWVCMKFTIQT